MKKLVFIFLLSAAASSGYAQIQQTKKDTAKVQFQRPTIRVPFNQIFTENVNGSFTPKYPVGINGVTMGTGVAFSPGVSFGGIDITTLKGHDLAVDTVKGVVIIKGHY